LNKEKYQVIFAVIGLHPEQEAKIPDAFPQIRFDLPNLHGWRQFFFSLQLCWLMFKHNIKIIHMNSYHPGNYIRPAAYLARVPIIIDHWHGFNRFSFKRKMLCRLYNRFTALSFAVSAGVGEYVQEQCGTDPARIKVLYNAVDLAPIDHRKPSRQMREELGLPRKQPVVGLVARLDPMKDHPTFLRAAALVRAQRPETRFVCVGGGPTEALNQLKRLAGELGLGESLIWAGPRTDMPGVYNALDLMVLSSAFGEGFPNVVGEAMACAKPVVVTRVGDAAWVAGRPELTVAPGDPEALARAVLAVLDQPSERRQALGRELRARVVEGFSLPAMIAASEAVLSDLIAPSHRN
jgi:glycosyltransferase involved in cell wall biosynthesis